MASQVRRGWIVSLRAQTPDRGGEEKVGNRPPGLKGGALALIEERAPDSSWTSSLLLGVTLAGTQGHMPHLGIEKRKTKN